MRSSIDAFVEVIVAIVNIVLIVAIVVIEAAEVKVNRRCQCGCKRGDLTVFCCRGDSMCVRKAKWCQTALYA